jgi:hypothetical protein
MRAMADLQGFVDAFHKAFPGEPINIIAHSEGTVITVAALQQGMEANQVILLNTPLRPDADSTQREFVVNDALKNANRITALYSSKDKIVAAVNRLPEIHTENVALNLKDKKFFQLDVAQWAPDHTEEKSAYTQKFGPTYALIVQTQKEKQKDLWDDPKNRDKLAELLGIYGNVSVVTPRTLPKSTPLSDPLKVDGLYPKK